MPLKKESKQNWTLRNSTLEIQFMKIFVMLEFESDMHVKQR